MLRDSALAASGLLVEKIGGPSVKPYQPSGIWEESAMPESNTKTYVQDKGKLSSQRVHMEARIAAGEHGDVRRDLT